MPNTCVAFGAFDGVHAGHRALVEKLVSTARNKGLSSVLVLFDGGADASVLTTDTEKRHLLSEYPLDAVISMPYAAIDISYIENVLIKDMKAKTVVAGENHKNLSLIEEYGAKYGFDVVKNETVSISGLPVTSARIRQALAGLRLDESAVLLGKPYFVSGRVVSGKKLGRTVGRPTANIDFPNNKILPPEGVYVTVTRFDGESFIGLTNVGKRPSVDNSDHTTIENHIPNFTGNLYGKLLFVEFTRFLRPVRKFENLEAVKAQIDKDVKELGMRN